MNRLLITVLAVAIVLPACGSRELLRKNKPMRWSKADLAYKDDEALVPPAARFPDADAEVLLSHGLDVQVSCQSGVCGTCLTRVIEGKPDHRDMVQTATEKAGNGKIALCCSRAKTRKLLIDI